MTIRVNRIHHNRDQYLSQLAAAEIDARACPYSADGINLSEPVDVSALPGFHAGHCSVQDESAQLAAELVLQRKATKVLDACCAPGGKTGHLLEVASAELTLDALDIEPSRLLRVQENLDRLALNANLIAANAGDIDSWWNGEQYDAILLDAPCSATGVIRRNPDIKMLRKPQDIAKLAALQQTLLKALWQCVKPGGILVYATCSIIPVENAKTVEKFVSNTSDATEQKIVASWGIEQNYGRQILPSVNGSDGFYYACLQKNA